MTAGSHPALDLFLKRMVERGEFPGAAYAVGGRDGTVFAGAVGRLAVEPRGEPLPEDPVYDLASLTKPLAAGLLAFLLAEEGSLRLEDPVSRHLPEWATADRAGVSLLDLLLHRSGLPAWEPLYLRCPDPDRVVAYLAARDLESRPGSRAVYSCLGFILLGRALEAAGGAGLDRLFEERVARPLGLRSTVFTPSPAWLSRIAPTEEGNRRERDLAGPAGDGDSGWPEGVVRGVVHDRNARHLRGIAGNAGLFGTAAEVERLARAFLQPGLLGEISREAVKRVRTPAGETLRTPAFESALAPGSAAGPALGGDAFGHTGFTGTSVFIDPGPGRTFVLLTNRVHPRWRAEPFHPVRRAFHEAAAGALEERGL